MNTLELRHIRKSFDGQGVLEDISLSVPAGSVTAIIGPSGSGKSTLLRCATLLETADGGDIIYEGKYAAKDGVYAPKAELHAIRRYFGLVFQSYNLFPHFTLLKNVMDAPVQVQKRPAAEVREEAMALLGKMGLADRADAYPCQLSGGQQQRQAAILPHSQAAIKEIPKVFRSGVLWGIFVARQTASMDGGIRHFSVGGFRRGIFPLREKQRQHQSNADSYRSYQQRGNNLFRHGHTPTPSFSPSESKRTLIL